MLDALTVFGLAKKTFPGVFIAAKARLENFDRAGPVVGVFGAVYHGSAALTHAFYEAVSGDAASCEILLSHWRGRK